MMKAKKPLIAQNCREFIMWNATFHAKASRYRYIYNIEQFLKWTLTTDNPVTSYKKLAKLSKKKIEMILEDYSLYLVPRVKPSTMRFYLASLESFLDYHEVMYNKKKIHRLIPKQNKPAGHEAWSIEEIQQMLDYAGSLRNKALLLLLPSSGIRRGGPTGLKVGHLIPIEDCFAIRVYADDPEDENAEYITFCTPEARKAIEEYLEQRKNSGEKITPESFVFIHQQKQFRASKNYDKLSPLPEDDIGSIVKKIIKRAKIKRIRAKNSTLRYTKAQVQSLRKTFDTGLNLAKVKVNGKSIPAISRNDQEKMMGHRSTSSLPLRYYDAQAEELFEEFKKAIPYLTIQKHLIQEHEISELKETTNKQEHETINQMHYMKSQIEELRSELSAVKEQRDIWSAEQFSNEKKMIQEKMTGLSDSQKTDSVLKSMTYLNKLSKMMIEKLEPFSENPEISGLLKNYQILSKMGKKLKSEIKKDALKITT